MQTFEIAAQERIVNALAVVIARDGYRDSKIQDVVREARVSLRTFYKYFDSKEACFLTLHAQIVEAVTTTVEGSVEFDRPWREVMRHGFETYYGLLVSFPRLTTAVMLEIATLGDEAFRAREQAIDGFCSMLIGLVDDGRAAYPEIPSRALSPLMARSVLGGILELVLSRVGQGEIERLPEFVDTSTDLLWSVVTHPG